MGNIMEKLFVDPEHLPEGWPGMVQMLFLGAVYGYILLHASNMISDSSELLLLTKWASLVGPVVLPVLGAVPDGAVIMFSGAKQRDLGVGVGALAGSTIMLLTVPWSLATISGRVMVEDSNDGDKQCNYRNRPRAMAGYWWSHLTNHGCAVDSSIRRMGWFMMLSCTTYLVIQVPAFRWGCAEEGCGCISQGVEDPFCTKKVIEGEKVWALVGFILAFVLFAIYLGWQYTDTVTAEHLRQSKIKDVADRLLQEGMVDLYNITARLPELAREPDRKDRKSVIDIVIREKFFKYDKDRSGDIDQTEWPCLAERLAGEKSSGLLAKLKEATEDDGKVSFEEFSGVLHQWMRGTIPRTTDAMTRSVARRQSAAVSEEEEDSDEDLPEDIAQAAPEERTRLIWSNALTGMLSGTALVLLFADPLVGILGELGRRTGIPGFYVSFVLAPLASNASELVAAMNYAAKKTKSSFTISLENLLGAACMNNTFCLGIFLTQVYQNSLIWEFSAETLSIVTVEIIMFYFAQQNLHMTWEAPLIMMMFPLSLAFVYLVEKKFGLD
eukprot:TRINITY_DN46819_c0_g1_i1.p1 TRINITY_DN46819_c0_g1~~TRINITY_DN46819_c0_g1_i1.p1  ORF type:complete len:592 (+),score=215.81 TRINITY_DN46819_c0_g1_i1:119-1777(+)